MGFNPVTDWVTHFIRAKKFVLDNIRVCVSKDEEFYVDLKNTNSLT
jgi:hypothetical protein